MTRPLDRPEVLPGQTYKVKWPESDHAIYITVNDIIQDGRRRPFEVFINSKNTEHYAWTVGADPHDERGCSAAAATCRSWSRN